jgi:outer membrane lipoprotein carrier protein
LRAELIARSQFSRRRRGASIADGVITIVHLTRMRKLSCVLVLLGLSQRLPTTLCGQTAPQPQLTVAQVAQRVDKYYNGLHSLRVTFTESFRGMGIDRKERGTLLLRKPGKMRWNYASPAGKIFLLDGKYAWFYSPGDAQVERVPASQLDDLRSPLRFLLGHTQLQKELEGLRVTASPDGLQLSGVPKGMQNRVAKIALGISTDGAIHSMSVTETDGAETAFTFKDSLAGAAAPDTDFVFHPPPGIPVVDGLPPV